MAHPIPSPVGARSGGDGSRRAAPAAAALRPSRAAASTRVRAGEPAPVSLPPADELQFEVVHLGPPGAGGDAQGGPEGGPSSTAGTVTLRWRLAEGVYELEWLQRRAGAALTDEPARRALSRGRAGPAGLLPERFDDERHEGARKAWRVAHFRRDEGLLSYSGSTTTHALQDGTQDGASWLVQLVGLANAARPAWRAGEVIELRVAGLRGELDVWRFEVQRGDAAALAQGEADADQDVLTLRRPSLRPYDPAIEVTLDRAAPHWPQCIKFIQAAGRAVEWRRAAHSGTAAVALTGPVPQVGE